MRRMNRFIVVLLLLLTQSVGAADAVNPQQEIERHPGDTASAVKHLGDMLQDRFRKNTVTVRGFSGFSGPSQDELS